MKKFATLIALTLSLAACGGASDAAVSSSESVPESTPVDIPLPVWHTPEDFDEDAALEGFWDMEACGTNVEYSVYDHRDSDVIHYGEQFGRCLDSTKAQVDFFWFESQAGAAAEVDTLSTTEAYITAEFGGDHDHSWVMEGDRKSIYEVADHLGIERKYVVTGFGE